MRNKDAGFFCTSALLGTEEVWGNQEEVTDCMLVPGAGLKL